MRGVAERTVPYPRLLPAPAFVDPLWERTEFHGGSARKFIESNGAVRARASADIGTSAAGPSAWLVRETRCPISPPGDAPIATPGVTSLRMAGGYVARGRR